MGHNRYPRVTRAFLDEPWAILPSKLEALSELIALKVDGGQVAAEDIEAITAAAPPAQTRNGAVAVLPVFGVLAKRMNMMTAMSGGTSVEMLSAEFNALVRDPNISAIVLQMDSPGGQVSGIPEFAEQIYRARSTKPIVASADTLSASAAYWLASAAHEIVGGISAEVGSVGVLAAHVDESGRDEKEGMQVSFISAGRYKTEGNPHEPLSAEARDFIQGHVDEIYAQFTNDIARFRGVSVADARGAAYGEGRVLYARQARDRGMLDRVETIDATIDRLSRPQGRSAIMRAEELHPVTIETISTGVESDTTDFEALIDYDMLADRVAERLAARQRPTFNPQALAAAVAECINKE